MPCRDDYPVPPQIDFNTAKANVARIKRKLEPLLCEACDLLEQAGALKKASKELKAWADAHEKKEQARIKKETEAKLKEQTKKKALAKLTPKEKRALGLK